MSPRIRFVLVSSLFSACCLASLHAALEFEATEVVVKPSTPGEKKLTGEFKFKNTGDAPVTITEVHSGCGCTTPERPKEPIAPGASGVIPVTYAGGERQGKQTQHIQVKTSDGADISLRLVAELPTRVTFAPRMLLFNKDEREAKTATLTYGSDTPVTVVSVASKAPGFELAEPEKLEGDVLTLKFRYVGAAEADTRGVIEIRTRGASGLENTDLLYVRHRP